MPANILMPALSPTMEKGTLAKWLKKEGDAVKSGDVLAEIETDKATMEVEAIDEGILAKILVPDGTADVPVNALIAIIAAEGETVDAASALAASTPAPKAPTQATETLTDAASPKSDAVVPAASKAQTPPLEAEATAKPASSQKSALNGANPHPSGSAKEERVIASPLARRIARSETIDLRTLQGSGPHGRIIERDIKAAIAARGTKSTPATSLAASPESRATPAMGMPDDMVKKLFEAGSFTEVPHDSMRKTIARRLVEAKTTVPHFYVSADCELDALLALRETVNASAPMRDGKPAFRISVNDFVIKALALALMRVPDANVTWTEGAMLKHTRADVGVAVSIPNGLITPVVRGADTKTLSVISSEMRDYAARAKARKLKPEEYQGGTTAVSNLGMFGVKNFAAIINPPHATILAVGAGEKRIVVRGDAPAVATVMTVTLSTDHRAVDGALGAELLSAFKSLIEQPMGMLV